MDKKILENIGLTKGESRTYLALLELGSSTVTSISKRAEVSISKVYQVLDGIIKKGLATSTVKNRVRYFNPSTPERILDFLKEKKQGIESNEKEIERYLPELKIKFNSVKTKPISEVFEGIQGIKTFFETMLLNLNKDDVFFSLGIPKESEKYEGYFFDWQKRRIAKKILAKGVFNFDAKRIGEKRGKMKLTEIRYLPKNLTTSAWFMVYLDTVGIIHLGENPLCIVIYDEIISKTYKKYFEALWKQAKP